MLFDNLELVEVIGLEKCCDNKSENYKIKFNSMWY